MSRFEELLRLSLTLPNPMDDGKFRQRAESQRIDIYSRPYVQSATNQLLREIQVQTGMNLPDETTLPPLAQLDRLLNAIPEKTTALEISFAPMHYNPTLREEHREEFVQAAQETIDLLKELGYEDRAIVNAPHMGVTFPILLKAGSHISVGLRDGESIPYIAFTLQKEPKYTPQQRSLPLLAVTGFHFLNPLDLARDQGRRLDLSFSPTTIPARKPRGRKSAFFP